MSRIAARRRADIQALRAAAVVLVILDHLVLLQRLPGHPEGGFVGVDVFFVISGFLITGHLLAEAERTGRVSFGEFYVRRARRILPMSFLVIVVTLIASAIVFWPARAAAAAWDGVWSLLFVSNLAFSLQGVDYFAPTTVSIFQHYWSLSVEEQFYLVWPVLIAGVAALAIRRARPARPWLVGMMVLVGAAAFVWACIDSAQNPVSAYFSTFVRGFEFILGALVAALAPRLSTMSRPVRGALSVVGTGGIVVSVWVVQPGAGFPGPMALLPAGAAAIFIAAGTGSESDRPLLWWPLATRPVQYIGDISYSLYLWHWPVIVIVGALMPTGILSILLVLVATAALSVASYRWVELTVLRSSWLQRSHRPGLGRRVIVRSTAFMAAAVVAAAVAVAGGALWDRQTAAIADAVPVDRSAVDRVPALDAVRADMALARERDRWEALSPAIDAVSVGTSEILTDDCWNDRDTVTHHCVLGPDDAGTTIAVFGDSMAMNWVPGLWEAIADRGWRLSVYAKVGCPYADVPVYDTDGSVYATCERFREWAIEQIDADRPDHVVLASAVKKDLPGAAGDDQLAQVWREGVARTLAALAVPTTILTAPPEGVALESCANRFTTPVQCSSTVTGLWRAVRDATASAAEGIAEVVDVSPWFCADDGVCPAVIGDIPVRRDTVHMTDRFSERLAPLLDARVLARASLRP